MLTNAVPSIFPWNPVKKCLSLTSQKALQPLKTECLEQSSCLVTKSLESFSMLNDSVEFESRCEFSSVQEDNLELQSILTETKRKLAEAERKLVETEKKLMETEGKLAEARPNLSDAVNKLAVTEKKLNASLFRLDTIKHDDSLVKFYTGLPCYGTLSCYFEDFKA